ncbi:hypothetical protein NADFUDRAFT_45810 [Nadsonia fulvescens var. elongata DSM 6958]|uniref:Uncharacterized protein n=1 Tax=Nadsonia fulvescens var. elongata DSM 6958 TaxID=857566 RepID=A0A1E3PLY7_9ASCO|nr:hypothetical protein NADFUDRAFT_45810 [Nadsonia fulvescens var. elongata DSM 6958]
MREFQQIFEEKNLSQLFISLDTIIQEAQDRKQRYTQKFQATQNPKIDSMDVDDGAEIENSIDVLDKPLMVAELTPDKIMASHLRAIQEREVIMLESALDNATNAYRDTLSRLNDSQIKIGLHAANLTKAFTALDELVHHSQTMLTRAEVNERIDQINFY